MKKHLSIIQICNIFNTTFDLYQSHTLYFMFVVLLVFFFLLLLYLLNYLNYLWHPTGKGNTQVHRCVVDKEQKQNRGSAKTCGVLFLN